MTIWISVGAYILFLAVFWFFVLSILWHLKEFSTDTDYSALSVKIFTIISITLSVASLILFLRLPFINL